MNKLCGKHRTAGKTLPVMGGVYYFNIVDGRRVFYLVRAGCRVNTLAYYFQLGNIVAYMVNPLLLLLNVGKHLLCECNGRAAGRIFLLGVVYFFQHHIVIGVRCHQFG